MDCETTGLPRRYAVHPCRIFHRSPNIQQSAISCGYGTRRVDTLVYQLLHQRTWLHTSHIVCLAAYQLRRDISSSTKSYRANRLWRYNDTWFLYNSYFPLSYGRDLALGFGNISHRQRIMG